MCIWWVYRDQYIDYNDVYFLINTLYIYILYTIIHTHIYIYTCLRRYFITGITY